MFRHRNKRINRPPLSARRVAAALAIAVVALAPNEVPLARAADAHWTQLTTSGPHTRFCTAIHDPVNRRKIIFGGHEVLNAASPSRRVFTFSLDSLVWNEAFPSGGFPTPRVLNAAVYDPVRSRMVIFGGGYGQLLNDVWELQLPADGTMRWREIMDQGAPSPRQVGVDAYDPVRDRMLIFGGALSAYSYTNEVWALNFFDSTWELLTTSGTPPSPRRDCSGIYDPIGDRLVIYGGTGMDDTWQLTLAGTPTWTQLPVSGPPPSAPGGAVFDPVRSRMLMFFYPDVWSLNLIGSPSWSQLAVEGVTSDVGTLTPIYDPVGDRVITERDRGGYYLDPYPHLTWSLNFDAPTAVLIGLANVQASPGRVRLAWHAEPGAILSADLERRTKNEDWRHLASIRSDGSGELRYEDREVEDGERYAYRLAYRGRDVDGTTPETWVHVPSAALSLQGPPLGGDGLVVTFGLPTAGPARLAAYDVSGRRIIDLEVGSLGVGQHTLELSGGRGLPAGVYQLDLVQGGSRVTARVILFR